MICNVSCQRVVQQKGKPTSTITKVKGYKAPNSSSVFTPEALKNRIEGGVLSVIHTPSLTERKHENEQVYHPSKPFGMFQILKIHENMNNHIIILSRKIQRKSILIVVELRTTTYTVQ